MFNIYTEKDVHVIYNNEEAFVEFDDIELHMKLKNNDFYECEAKYSNFDFVKMTFDYRNHDHYAHDILRNIPGAIISSRMLVKQIDDFRSVFSDDNDSDRESNVLFISPGDFREFSTDDEDDYDFAIIQDPYFDLISMIADLK